MGYLFVVDIKGLVQLIEPENRSNNCGRRDSNQGDLWFIMKRAPGQSLKEFMERRRPDGLYLLEAIQLTLKLSEIVQQMHNRNTVHQNLSPDNIIIELGSTSGPIKDAQLTLVNFSQAVNISKNSDATAEPSMMPWYRAPQAAEQNMDLHDRSFSYLCASSLVAHAGRSLS